ncbi:hypothetical protein ACFYZN_20030 [Streptomyces sp. NPDC001777]|uniref:hypothetical protein n=1 Tax=Streptomyces sp. NPDC001777 TaxID=3364608 RepID=UPI00367764AC
MFSDRVLVVLVHLRTRLPLAVLCGGYRGLANEFSEQVGAPPKKPKEDAPLGDQYAWREHRRRQSSARIRAEHANAEHRQWRPPRALPGHAPGHRRPALRPSRPAAHPPRTEHRTRARQPTVPAVDVAVTALRFVLVGASVHAGGLVAVRAPANELVLGAAPPERAGNEAGNEAEPVVL